MIYMNDIYADTLINKLADDLKAESVEFDEDFFTCHVNFDDHVLTIRFNEFSDASLCNQRSEFYLDHKFLINGIKNPCDFFDAINDSYECVKEVRFNL